jgi:type III secretion protein Q
VAVEFGLRLGEDRIGVDLQHWPPGAFFPRVPTPAFHELPRPMALALLEAALSGTLKAAEAAIGQRIRLEPEAPEAGGPGELRFGFQWRVRRDSADCVLCGALRVPENARSGVIGALKQRRRRLLMPWASLPVPLSLGVGHCFLAAGQLAQLHPGDVVLCDRSAPPNSLFLHVAPRLTALGKFDPAHQRLEILAVMENPAPTPPADPLLRSPDEIPVELFFELGTTKLTLGQFKQLSVGSILECPGVSLDAPVTVRVHGNRVADAELVMVGDRLGIRLLHIFQG